MPLESHREYWEDRMDNAKLSSGWRDTYFRFKQTQRHELAEILLPWAKQESEVSLQGTVVSVAFGYVVEVVGDKPTIQVEIGAVQNPRPKRKIII